MIFHLLYVSTKSEHFKDDDIDHVIARSQKNNEPLQVTGLLINNGEFFIQLLEGKKEDVMRTYDRISEDRRHFRLRVLLTAESASRVFPEWAMGLVREPTESTMNQILPFLHTELKGHAEVRLKIHAALKSFNSGAVGKRRA